MFRNATLRLAALIAAILPMTVNASVSLDICPSSTVSFERALADANRITALFSGWEVYRAVGDSMHPHYGANSLVVIAPARAETIAVGNIVVFVDAAGDRVAHTVIARNGDTITTAGANTQRLDPSPLSVSQVLGVAVGVMHTSGIDANAELPVVIGKRY
jgi:hypothetical protein